MLSIRYLIPFPALGLAVGSLFLGCTGSKTGPGATQAATLAAPQSYAQNCRLCHGAKGQGVKNMGPSLQNLKIRIPDDMLHHIIRNGRGKMPAFKEMPEAEAQGLIAYIKTL